MVAYEKVHPEPKQRHRYFHYCCFLALLFTFITLYTFGLLALTKKQADDAEIAASAGKRLVCYYSSAGPAKLSLLDVPGNLCTHINIGIANLSNTTLEIPPDLAAVLQNETCLFREKNPQVKLLLWIGGGDSGHEFAEMVVNHETRKQFIRSVRDVLKQYPSLDGIDLDWEFPSACDKERQHFSQLLYEIRMEWIREKLPDNILSLAVAAPEGIAYFAYDMQQINLYVDYVNLMAYDFHFYRKDMPFTGLNAPLFARAKESSIMATFNINYTVNWWLKNGLEPQRLVVGLPTFGHSYTLVSPFNSRVGAPARGIGKCGEAGFTTLTATCECIKTFFAPNLYFDRQTCSPYLSAIMEWISYENAASISCKAHYIKAMNLGGIMVFSLNTDDLKNKCGYMGPRAHTPAFPLVETAKRILLPHY
ncbi:Cht11 [Drosophila busckii]|uniref:Cht11 n=1 Tax=Drosophila busckii TaxID=30019 RepID=A0A0M3QZE6_DROBS|nr:chitinase-3-like protein 1 [Drosophila busckii]ALC49239.1 Cht11 [Drosophila busckii]